MSLSDSMVITAQTVVSNGFGASVGLEAAYTQMGAGFASFMGAALGLRRPDLRTLVACGSAGAIAAAFGGPLTGAFYAFELDSRRLYALRARSGGRSRDRRHHLGARARRRQPIRENGDLRRASFRRRYGVARAARRPLRGIRHRHHARRRLRRRAFRWTRLPLAMQPAIGGLIVGGLALVTPAALSSGHGATIALFDAAAPALSAIGLALAVKSVASMISIGSGFRGGLFFASLYLGSLIGELYCRAIALYFPSVTLDSAISAVVGMTGLAVAVVGGPLTMSFLALETTGDFALSLAHAGHRDAGLRHRAAELRLFLRDMAHAPSRRIDPQRAGCRLDARSDRRPIDAHRCRDRAGFDMRVSEFRRRFALGSAQWVVAVDPLGRYKGMIFVPDAHLASADAGDADLTSRRCRACPIDFWSPR